MTRKIPFLTIAMIAGISASAQHSAADVSRLCASSKMNHVQAMAKTTVASPLEDQYDVKYVKLDLAMTNQSTTLSGSATTRAQVIAPSMAQYAFELAQPLVVDSVKVDGQLLTATTSGVVRTVSLPASLSNGILFTAQVFYHGQPVSGTPFDINGINTLPSPSWGTQATFTLSQPYSANEWWPCKQSLGDKIDSTDIWITVSNNLKAGSNGVLQTVTPLPGNRQRFEWKHRHAIDYYLLSAAVAPYVDYSYYVHFPGGNDSMLVQNYIYSNPQTLTFWKDEIDSTGSMILHFSELFGRYPFWKEKYGHCMAPFSGGMEHQTMTTQGNFEGTLTAHELGHQWFGDHVTCGTWKDIWLNEGFASYAEYLFVKQFRGNTAAFSYMQNVHQFVMFDQNGNILPDGTLYVDDTTDAGRIFDSRLSYNKGSAVVHMLRFAAPDDNRFFQLLKTYQQQYAHSTATTEDFKALAAQVYGQNMDTFFNQWVYGEAFPSYQLKWNQLNGQVHVSLLQTSMKPSSVPLFHTPLEIRFSTPQGDTTIRIYNDKAVQNFSFNWSKPVASVAIDPNNWILNHVSAIDYDPSVLSVRETGFETMQVQPNPTSHHWTVTGLPAQVSWQLCDLSGRTVNGGTGSGSVSVESGGLPSGLYLFRVSRSGEAAVTLKLIKQ